MPVAVTQPFISEGSELMLGCSCCRCLWQGHLVWRTRLGASSTLLARPLPLAQWNVLAAAIVASSCNTRDLSLFPRGGGQIWHGLHWAGCGGSATISGAQVQLKQILRGFHSHKALHHGTWNLAFLEARWQGGNLKERQVTPWETNFHQRYARSLLGFLLVKTPKW